MQTWLVHTRHPWRLARELGFRGSLGFTLVGTGLIVSAMIYPVYLAAGFTLQVRHRVEMRMPRLVF